MSSEYIYPLATNQKQIWLDQLFYPETSYNIGCYARIEGRFEPDVFEKALTHVVSRNDALRTILHHGDPLPAQEFPEHLVFNIESLDFSEKHHPHDDAVNWMKEQLAIPFHVIGEALFRFAIIKISESCSYWFQKYHHIMIDGWGFILLSKQVFNVYNALLSGETVEEKQIFSYADFINDDQNYISSKQFEKDARFWLEQYPDLPPSIIPRRYADLFKGKAAHGCSSTLRVQRNFFNRVKAFADANHVSVFHVMLASVYCYFMRVSGEQDFAIGVPVYNRNTNNFRQTIGMFTNIIPVRLQFNDDLSLIELMHAICQKMFESYPYARFPLSEINKKSKLLREHRKQVFDITLSSLMHNHFRVSGRVIETGLLPSGGFGQGALALVIDEFHSDKDVFINFEYSPEAFNEAEIERMKTHFEFLLKDMLHSAAIPIRHLRIVPDEEQCTILHEFNHATAQFPEQKTVIDLFEEQVAKNPEQLAVIFEKHELSYQALHHKANQIAHCLKACNLAPEERIGVFVNRSEWLMICLLGILKAGGAYLPIDPSYPPERIGYILNDSGCHILLTETEQRNVLSRLNNRLEMIDIHAIRSEAPKNVTVQSRPEQLAYVIYTSGSTGQPKGVMIEHRGLSNMILAQISLFGIHRRDRILQFASCGFDASMSEIFTAFCSGAALVCLREEQREPEQLIQTIDRRHVTVATLPPSLLRMMGFERLRNLRVLITAGEEAIPEDGTFIDERHQYWNAYGPTENSVCSTCFRVPPATYGADRLLKQRIPIGKPIVNTQALILNPAGDQLQPIGVSGEIGLAGIGLARGYLNQPELTKAKFVAHPYNAGERLYRTGDVGRWLPDGNLEFLGRKDSQVKIRGFRIELTEIELALARHQAVRQALVMARQDQSGNMGLIAYIILEENQSAPTASELSAFLKHTLPEYMLPSHFIVIDAIPMTPNGKADLPKLPAPGPERPDLGVAYVAPRNKSEAFLAELWQAILQLAPVGVHDNFFELGGDSLKAAMLFARLREKFTEYMYGVAIFEAPTIRQLASYLGTHYPETVAQVFEHTSLPRSDASRHAAIDQIAISEIRKIIVPLPPKTHDSKPETKNPPAIFILSPPRSGSTLLRVMLAGHPALFAPPELELLSFNTLAERKAAFGGKFGFWLEGTIRAIMEIKHCPLDQARMIMDACEHQGMTVKDFYKQMQAWFGEKMLVEKTPSYSLDPEILKRAELDFDRPVYIHLLRHPLGMIRSFVKARLDQVFFRHAHRFSTQELAELIFIVSHQHILEFLRQIPASRQYRLTFEDLVKTPQAAMEGVCRFLHLEFQAEMLQPHKDGKAKMTDGIHPLSRMLGDVKFHEHTHIDSGIADQWKIEYHDHRIGEIAWDLAQRLGYAPQENQPPGLPLVSIQPEGKKRPLVCVHPGDGNVFLYHELARQLGKDQPFYGLQALGLDLETSPLTSFQEMAETYLRAVQRRFPEGPYMIAGFCAGGIIAYEMAQQLLSKGEQVLHLLLIDSFTPQAYAQRGFLQDETMRFMTFIRYVGEFLAADMFLPYCRLRGIPMDRGYEAIKRDLRKFSPDERFNMLYECIQQSGNGSRHFGRASFQRAHHVYMGIHDGIRGYSVLPYNGSVAVFRAQEALDPNTQISDSSLGWKNYCDHLEVHAIPGNHFTMLKQPQVSVLAQKLHMIAEI